jgi:recombination protein RecA
MLAKGVKKEPINSSGDIQARIRLAMAQTEKQFGVGTVSILGVGAKPVPLSRKDSGSHYLNDILGGGYPEGRIVEVYGPESSGKTTVALHAVAEALKADTEKFALYVDAEHALDTVYAEKLGVPLDRLILVQPDTAEQALQLIELWMEYDCISIYVLDSVAALVTKREIEGEIGDSYVGVLALLMSTTLKKIAALTNRTKTIGIFINQLREKVGILFGNPETTPGGRALKFYASVRLDIRPAGVEKRDDNPYIRKTKIKIVKSKVSTPHREVEVDIEFGKGISRSGEIVDIGVDLGLIAKSGSWFSYKEDRVQGRDAMKDYLENNREVMKELDDLIKIMNSPSENELVEEPELGDVPPEDVDIE